MKRVILLRGAPGKGKSTLAEELTLHVVGAVSFAADDWMVNQKGSYEFDHTKLGYVHEQCQLRCKQMMQRESPLIIVCNTFTKLWEMEPYILLAQQNSYELSVLHYEGPQRQNIHGVSEEKVRKMIASHEPYRG